MSERITPQPRAALHPGGKPGLDRALDHHPVAGGQAIQDLDLPFPALPDGDRCPARRVLFVDSVDEALGALADHGEFRNHQRPARGCCDLHRHQHSGTQPEVRVGEDGAHGHRAGDGVDQRVDGGNRAAEGLAGKGGGLGLDGKARLDRRDEHLRHREIQLDPAVIDDGGNRRSGIDDCAGRNPAQRQPAREGRAHDPVADLAGGRGRLGARDVDGGLRLLDLGAGCKTVLLQGQQAIQPLLRLDEARLAFVERGALLGADKLGDDRPARHIGAILEVDPRDALGDGRVEVRLLVGKGGAHGLDPVDQFDFFHRANEHRRRAPAWAARAAARTASAGRLAIAGIAHERAAGDDRKGEQHGRKQRQK
jgi:hypothetical protein